MQADSKNGGYFCQHDCSLKCRFTVYSSTSVVRVTREASRKGAQGNPRQEMQMGTILRILSVSNKSGLGQFSNIFSM